jgi:hypothetical protein
MQNVGCKVPLKSLTSVQFFTACCHEAKFTAGGCLLKPAILLHSNLLSATNKILRNRKESTASEAVKQSANGRQRKREEEDERQATARVTEFEDSILVDPRQHVPTSYVLSDNFGRPVYEPDLSACGSKTSMSKESLQQRDEYLTALFIDLSIMWSWQIPIIRRARVMLDAFGKIFSEITEIYG